MRISKKDSGASTPLSPEIPAQKAAAKPVVLKGASPESTSGSWGGFDISTKLGRVTKAAPVAAADNPDSDPLNHIKFLSSKELAGRGSPSVGFDKASAYYAGLLQKYGFQPANPKDASGNGYFQTFDLFSRGAAPGRAFAGHAHQGPLGPRLFERGAYVSDSMSKDDQAAVRASFGIKTGKGFGKKGPLTADELRAAGATASNVQNVVGVLPGSGPHKDEYIVLMAHLDHLGQRGSTYYPGADDNASGSSCNLSTLPALQELAKAGKLDRSILVVATAAEEKGLIGGAYFANHPLPGIPLDKIKLVINNDMVGRYELDRMSIIDTGLDGKDHWATKFVKQANSAVANPFTTVNHDLEEFKDRQDGFVFMRKKIPMIFFYEGLSNPKGGGEEMPDYHQPTDTVENMIKDNGGGKAARFRDFSLELIKLAANSEIK